MEMKGILIFTMCSYYVLNTHMGFLTCTRSFQCAHGNSLLHETRKMCNSQDFKFHLDKLNNNT